MDTKDIEIKINQMLDDELAIIAHDIPRKDQAVSSDRLNRTLVGMVETFRKSIIEVVNQMKTIEK